MIAGDWVWRAFLPPVVGGRVLVNVYVATCGCHPGHLIVSFEYTRDGDQPGLPHDVRRVFHPLPVVPRNTEAMMIDENWPWRKFLPPNPDGWRVVSVRKREGRDLGFYLDFEFVAPPRRRSPTTITEIGNPLWVSVCPLSVVISRVHVDRLT